MLLVVEILRFAMYLAVPTASILYFGDPEWYDRYVVPYGRKIWPDYETTHKPPHTQAGIQEQLAKFKAERLNKKKGQDQSEVTGEAVTPHIASLTEPNSVHSQLPSGTFDSRPTEGSSQRLV
ncbi:hypothetical protein QFC20_002587 [Naganishia adeliensis]|uniref:Uncharacterized protein n=1 Tax=Naganishia adeliensis TaxID=92952 RepID=A0ACC2WKG2_9TREE|nr:hypothetical protein QFC20_002587 [Naganishia adeliensis]